MALGRCAVMPFATKVADRASKRDLCRRSADFIDESKARY
jgi:hypothetical protein